jgi:AcrR family transcriptional regulator
MGNSRDVRERMLQAGGELLALRGFGVTLIDVVERANTPRGSIYYYFPDGKEQLFREVVSRTESDLVHLVEVVGRRNESTRDFLVALVEHHRKRLVASGYDAGCPLVALTTSSDLDTSGVRDAVESAFAAWTNAIAVELSRRELSPDQARRLAAGFLAAVEGAIVISRAHRDPAPLDAVKAMVPALAVEHAASAAS